MRTVKKFIKSDVKNTVFVDMARPVALLSACLITAVRAQESSEGSGDHVPSLWRTIAIALAILLVIIGLLAGIKICLPRLLGRNRANSVDEEPQICIISNGLINRNGVGKYTSNIQVASENGVPNKELTLDIDLAQMGPLSPGISVEPATPSCECPPEDVIPTLEPQTTDWVPSTPPPPPPGTLLWVPSTARRRSVSLRGDSDDEKEQKSVCSSCGGSISQNQTPNASPPTSMVLERKRSVTFNTSVEEIHVLSNEPKKPRSRSPSLLFTGPFYGR